MNALAPEIKIQWAISTLGKLIIYTLATFSLEYFFIDKYISNWLIFDYGLTLIVFLFFLTLVFIAPPLRYKYLK